MGALMMTESKLRVLRYLGGALAAASLSCLVAFSAGGADTPGPGPAHPGKASEGRPNVLDGTLRDNDPIVELSTSELQAVLRDRSGIVFDARPFAEYAVSHIPGALSVPAKPGLPPAQYTADANEVARRYPDRNQLLVLYCNGMYCGRSKRFGAELQKAGYKTLRRYQLGIPAWRALGGVTQVEKEALVALLAADRTAVLVDSREADQPNARLAGARSIPLREASKAKDDGRLPMADHNTRIFVVGDNGAAARAVAEAIVRDAFHNVSFFAGSPADLSELFVHDTK